MTQILILTEPYTISHMNIHSDFSIFEPSIISTCDRINIPKIDQKSISQS